MLGICSRQSQVCRLPVSALIACICLCCHTTQQQQLAIAIVCTCVDVSTKPCSIGNNVGGHGLPYMQHGCRKGLLVSVLIKGCMAGLYTALGRRASQVHTAVPRPAFVPRFRRNTQKLGASCTLLQPYNTHVAKSTPVTRVTFLPSPTHGTWNPVYFHRSTQGCTGLLHRHVPSSKKQAIDGDQHPPVNAILP